MTAETKIEAAEGERSSYTRRLGWGLRMNPQPKATNTLKRVGRECWRPAGLGR